MIKTSFIQQLYRNILQLPLTWHPSQFLHKNKSHKPVCSRSLNCTYVSLPFSVQVQFWRPTVYSACLCLLNHWIQIGCLFPATLFVSVVRSQATVSLCLSGRRLMIVRFPSAELRTALTFSAVPNTWTAADSEYVWESWWQQLSLLAPNPINSGQLKPHLIFGKASVAALVLALKAEKGMGQMVVEQLKNCWREQIIISSTICRVGDQRETK